MKKIIFAMAFIASAFACNKNTEQKTDAPIKYYFKIEAVDNDGKQSTITSYKTITIN